MKTSKAKKKIVLIGGAGTIGTILAKKLGNAYEIIVADRRLPTPRPEQYIELDALEYEALVTKLPKDADVLINLTALPPQEPLVEIPIMNAMVDLYVKAAYNIYSSAATIGIPRVIFASSNHVTDYYESDGHSSLHHEIGPKEYPLSRRTYGVLKLTGEGMGHVFFVNEGLSVICLRIGTVPLDERQALRESARSSRTLLTTTDTANLFSAAIETKTRYGVYYGVSDNPGRPWSISEAVTELGYEPSVNASDIVFSEDNEGLSQQ